MWQNTEHLINEPFLLENSVSSLVLLDKAMQSLQKRDKECTLGVTQ